MPKRRARFILPLTGLTLLLVIGVGLYIAAAAALDPAKLTAELQRSVKRATGRDLTVTGSVHLALGLAPSFVVDGVSLANLPGGSRPQMLTAKSMRADVALLPLLTGDAVVESLTIVQPDILLERAPDGTPNWQFTPVRRAALYQSQPGEPSGGGGGGGSHVEIHTLHVEGGQVTWQPASGARLVLGIDELTASNENPAAPLRIALKATQNGTPITVQATTGALDRLQGGPVSAMAGAWPLTLQVNAGDAVIKLDGGIAHPDQFRGYQFALTGNIPDMAAIAPFFPGVSIPPLKDVSLAARLADSASGDLRTSQLSVHAGAADLASWVTGLSIKSASFTAPGPGQNAQLNVDGFYADAPLHLAGTAMQPDLLAQNAPLAVTLSGQAGNADFSAKGSMPPALNASGLDLVVSAHAPDLAELSALVGRTLPPARDLQFDARIEDAGFKLRGVTLRDLSLSSSVAQISGNTTIVWSPRPGLNGTLAASHLDLDALFPDFSFANAVWAPPPSAVPTPPAAAAASAPPAPPPADPTAAQPVPTVISDRPLNFALFRNADADLTLTAAAVTAGGEHYRDVSGHLTLADGKAALNPFRLSAKSGVLVGGASIDANADQPPVAISLRASAFPAGLVAALAGVPGGGDRCAAARPSAQRRRPDTAHPRCLPGWACGPLHGERRTGWPAHPDPDRRHAQCRRRALDRRRKRLAPLPGLARRFLPRPGRRPCTGRRQFAPFAGRQRPDRSGRRDLRPASQAEPAYRQPGGHCAGVAHRPVRRTQGGARPGHGRPHRFFPEHKPRRCRAERVRFEARDCPRRCAGPNAGGFPPGADTELQSQKAQGPAARFVSLRKRVRMSSRMPAHRSAQGRKVFCFFFSKKKAFLP